MNPELRRIFMTISSEVSWLHAVWEIFIQLYGSSDDNVRLMNSVAPQYFAITKDVLFDELVLILCRLTDSAKTRSQDNATFAQLIEKLDQDRHDQLIKSLMARLEVINNKIGSFRVWRNKRLAHKDLSTALENDSLVLPGITRGDTQEVINEMVDFLNEFSIELQGEKQVYNPFLVHHGDGNALMAYLKRVEFALKEREA